MPTSDTHTTEIDWGTSTVEDSTLTVDLTGKSSKAWNEQFDAVLALLSPNHAGWGEIELVESKLRVSRVQPGAAPDLRHLLESVVRQVNSDLARDKAAASPTSDPRTEADEELAAAFRAFAEPRQA